MNIYVLILVIHPAELKKLTLMACCIVKLHVQGKNSDVIDLKVFTISEIDNLPLSKSFAHVLNFLFVILAHPHHHLEVQTLQDCSIWHNWYNEATPAALELHRGNNWSAGYNSCLKQQTQESLTCLHSNF